MIYDLIIIGGGPAGVSAGVYAARKRLKTLLIAPEFGGQSIVSDGIENWIGTVKISGIELANNLKKHLLAYAGDTLEVKEGESVSDIKKDGGNFKVVTPREEYLSKTVLIATGSTRRKLEVPGAEEFDNKGLTYCASCDGPLFVGQDVVVIGGGKSVTLLNRTENFRADEITMNKLKQNPNFKITANAVPLEIKGDNFVKSIVYEDLKTKEKHEIEASGIFVEIGLIPTTYFTKNVLELNKIGQIPVNPMNQQTKVSGVWAAGDCTDGLYHQNNIASGDAIKALEDIYIELNTK